MTLWIVATGASPLCSRRHASWLARWMASSASGNPSGPEPTRRVDAPPVAGEGVEGRLVDRLPAGDQVAEGLGHPVDVALPEEAGLGVDEPAFVLGEPPGQREVVQAHPHVDPGVAGRLQHLGVVLDRVGVVAAGLRARGGPTRATAGAGSGRARRRAGSPRRSGSRSRCRRPSAGHGRRLPRRTSRWPGPRPRSGWTTLRCPTGSRRADHRSSLRAHGPILPQRRRCACPSGRVRW